MLALSLFTFGHHLESGVLEIGNTSEMEGNDLRLCLLNNRLIFSAICSALTKKTRPSSRSNRVREMSHLQDARSERGRNTFVPGLRPRTYTGGSAA